MSKQSIEILARGVCVKDGRLLLCHSKGADNTYLPGGHVEFQEQASVALRRELQEEMGLDSTVGRFLGAAEHSFVQKGKLHCEINLVFELAIPAVSSESDPASCEDYIEFQWMDLAALEGSNLEPSVLRRCLPVWLSGEGPERWDSTY